MSEEVKKEQKKSWTEGLKSEFGKIVWPERPSVVKQTIAVSVISLILGGIIAILDFIVQYGVDILVNLG